MKGDCSYCKLNIHIQKYTPRQLLLGVVYFFCCELHRANWLRVQRRKEATSA